MEYTPNHHMPQWVKSDRIMMDDFNAAFASIETGLDKAQATAADVLGAAQSTDTRLRTIAADLSRDFYRLAIQQKLQHGTAGITDSMWLNAFNCREDAPGVWCGGSGLALSGKKATVAGIKATAEQISYVSTVPAYTYQSQTAAVTFISDGSGILEKVGFITEWNAQYTSTDVNFVVKLYEHETDQFIAESGPFATEQAYGQDYAYVRTVNLPVRAGVKYRMEFTVPAGQGYQRATYFVLGNTRRPHLLAEVLTIKDPAVRGSFTHTLTPPSWATGGIILIRWSGNGTITAAVNGKNMPVNRTRQYIDVSGQLCKETEVLLAALPAPSLSLGLALQAGPGGLNLFDCGMLWK